MQHVEGDAENQLDLFGAEDPLEESPDDGSFPLNIVLSLPCPWCDSSLASSVGDLRQIQALATKREVANSPVSCPDADPDCTMCSGQGSIQVKTRRVDDQWWDWDSDKILKADSIEKARRKAGKTEPTPLYVDHGF